MCATDIHFQKATEEVDLYVQKCVGTALCVRKKSVERTFNHQPGWFIFRNLINFRRLIQYVQNQKSQSFFKQTLLVCKV